MMAADAGVSGAGAGVGPVATTQNYVNAYTGAAEAEVGALFKEEGFADNDLVKPQSGSQATYSGGKWYGNLVFRLCMNVKRLARRNYKQADFRLSFDQILLCFFRIHKYRSFFRQESY